MLLCVLPLVANFACLLFGAEQVGAAVENEKAADESSESEPVKLRAIKSVQTR